MLVCPPLVALILRTAAAYFTIVSCHSFTASLFVAKHQVDPLVEMLWYIRTLQRCLVLLKKIVCIWKNGERWNGAAAHRAYCRDRTLAGRYLRPMWAEWRRQLNIHSAVCPNQGWVCFPGSCSRSHKTLESTTWQKMHTSGGFTRNTCTVKTNVTVTEKHTSTSLKSVAPSRQFFHVSPTL